MARWQPRLIVIKRVVPSRMPTASDSGTDSPLYPATPNPPAPAGHRGDVIAVSELNRRVRHMLEANLELLWVSGEISNAVKAASGHWYFSLKDAIAQVRCVMFRHRAAAIGFAPDNGMQVEVRALPSLYEPRGEFQLGVENMRRAGLGTLYEAFERLKARLQTEGLFSEDLAYLQSLYNRINALTPSRVAVRCPNCAHDVEVEVGPLGGSSATP